MAERWAEQRYLPVRAKASLDPMHAKGAEFIVGALMTNATLTKIVAP